MRGPVTSPTFVIARIHPSLTGGPDLVHADAYRLASPGGSGRPGPGRGHGLLGDRGRVGWRAGRGAGRRPARGDDHPAAGHGHPGRGTRAVCIAGHGGRWDAVGDSAFLALSGTPRPIVRPDPNLPHRRVVLALSRALCAVLCGSMPSRRCRGPAGIPSAPPWPDCPPLAGVTIPVPPAGTSGTCWTMARNTRRGRGLRWARAGPITRTPAPQARPGRGRPAEDAVRGMPGSEAAAWADTGPGVGGRYPPAGSRRPQARLPQPEGRGPVQAEIAHRPGSGAAP